MPRVKRGVTTHARHKKLLSLTKGYKHGRSSLFRQAKQAVLKAGQHSYRDRKNKKRNFRAHWIVVLNAAARQNGMPYKTFMFGLNKAGITLNRRVLADLARNHPEEFAKVADKVKAAV